MQTNNEKISLMNLNGGIAVARFDHELRKVLDNINDPNTTLKERRIVLEVKIKPAEDRENLDIKTSVRPFLSEDAPIVSRAFMGSDLNGNSVAHEIISKQVQLPLTPKEEQAKGNTMEAGNVVPMAKGGNE